MSIMEYADLTGVPADVRKMMVDAPIIRNVETEDEKAERFRKYESKRRFRKLKNAILKASLGVAILTGIGTICSDVWTPAKLIVYGISMAWITLVLSVNWERLNG